MSVNIGELVCQIMIDSPYVALILKIICEAPFTIF